MIGCEPPSHLSQSSGVDDCIARSLDWRYSAYGSSLHSYCHDFMVPSVIQIYPLKGNKYAFHLLDCNTSTNQVNS